MTTRVEVEARLERSLRGQISAPQLDARFDVRVWARIGALESPGRAAAAAHRWVFMSNVIGISVALVLVSIFGVRALAGLEPGFALPEISTAGFADLMRLLAGPITIVALGVGLVLTPFGRRVRAQIG